MRDLKITNTKNADGTIHFEIVDMESGFKAVEFDNNDLTQGMFYADGYIKGYRAGFAEGMTALYQKICEHFGAAADPSVLNCLPMN